MTRYNYTVMKCYLDIELYIYMKTSEQLAKLTCYGVWYWEVQHMENTTYVWQKSRKQQSCKHMVIGKCPYFWGLGSVLIIQCGMAKHSPLSKIQAQSNQPFQYHSPQNLSKLKVVWRNCNFHNPT